jgi:hypothetical protein
MIRAVVQNGKILPIDPMPPEWVEGQQVISWSGPWPVGRGSGGIQEYQTNTI